MRFASQRFECRETAGVLAEKDISAAFAFLQLHVGKIRRVWVDLVGVVLFRT